MPKGEFDDAINAAFDRQVELECKAAAFDQIAVIVASLAAADDRCFQIAQIVVDTIAVTGATL